MHKPKKAGTTMSNYWQERFTQLEQAMNAYGRSTHAEVDEAFRKAQSEMQKEIDVWYARIARNNQITLKEARKLLSKNELAEFHWSVEEYIKHGEENGLNGQWMKQLENASAKYHISRLEALKIHTQQIAEKAFGNELDAVDRMARKVYTEDYYRAAFEIQKGFGVGFNIGQIDENRLSKIIAKPWAADGKNFSSRIWQSKTAMVNELHQQLTKICVLGKSPSDAIAELSKYVDKRFQTSRAQAGRLIMTEQAFFASAGQRNCYQELGVEEFEVVATLDNHTSEICRSMDGKHFPMSEYIEGVTAPPFHVWCRSTTCPYFDDEFTVDSMRAARDADGKTEYIPADMKYGKWKEKYILDIKGATQAERKALNSYLGFESYPLNEALRNGETLTAEQVEMVENLDSLLDRLPKYKGDLTRSLYFRSEYDKIEFLEEYKVGQEVMNSQYLSTTKGDIYNPNGQVQIIINNAKNGIDISSINTDEQEVLYKRKSKFRVIDITEEEGKTYIRLEEVD